MIRNELGGLRLRVPFPVICATAATLAASVTLLISRSVGEAASYSQSYNCQSFVGQSTCHLTAGSWHNITNVGASNYTASTDICAQYGQLTGTYQCAVKGYSILLCSSTAVYQYGISETQNGASDNIAGHEDDSATCG